MVLTASQRSFRSKAILLFSFTIPTIISAVLLGLILSKTYANHELKTWVSSNRASVQIVVQVLSMLMGVCQIYGLSTSIRFWTNIRLSRTSISLNTLKLLDAITTSRLDLDVHTQVLSILLVYLTTIQIPSALWAGALTPVLTTVNANAQYMIPQYSNWSRDLWGVVCEPGVVCDDRFGISNQMAKTAGLLNSILEASSTNSSHPQVNKLDNSGYKFRGRSYGVASTVGLVADPSITEIIGSGSVQNFGYQELGYHSSVTCIYNNTNDLSLTEIGIFQIPDDIVDIYRPTGFWASGTLPTGKWDGYPTWAVIHNGTVTAIAAVTNSSHYMYGFIVGTYNAGLNSIQCEVQFTPKLFSVEVDQRSQIIKVDTVRTMDDTNSTMDHVPLDDSVIQTVFKGPSYLAQTLTTTYTSSLARAFKINVNNVSKRNNHTIDTANDYLIGISEGLETLLDHILGSTGAAQIKLASDSQLVPVNATIQVMQIGEAKYTYSIFAISLVMFMLGVADALWTRFWKALPFFDGLDLKSAILGVASGADTNDFESVNVTKQWDGDAANREMGMLRVVSSREKPVLSLTGLGMY